MRESDNPQWREFAAVVGAVGRQIEGPSIIVGKLVIPLGFLIREQAAIAAGKEPANGR